MAFRIALFVGWTCWLLGVQSAGAATLELRPVMTGLDNPLFVTHAGDGSNRLFVVEQAGTIRVAGRPAGDGLFLDIRARVLSGAERGLLGLAFHPLYKSNGRFFVAYTRLGDGAIVVAEYHTSNDPAIAATDERVLLIIPHPVNANHNGGMLAFGAGGYLFIGVGDGGAANDPPSNAQNIDTLLGKLLRVNVDVPDTAAGTPYSAPAGNPFVGRPGRDEIYATGLRNPWRFSVDRLTSDLWLGDVGQNRREEVDAPVLAGANYGWRIYEGSDCTGTDASLCRPENYVRPLFEYEHTDGRCSVTGGYVYRGDLHTLPSGTYVYGDFCSGEVFAWDGREQTRLMATGSNISSFGEDEQGELYVVSLGGTVARLVSDACDATVSPLYVAAPWAGLTQVFDVRIGDGCAWTARTDDPWMKFPGPQSGIGSGTFAVTITHLAPRPRRRTGHVTVAGQSITIFQKP